MLNFVVVIYLYADLDLTIIRKDVCLNVLLHYSLIRLGKLYMYILPYSPQINVTSGRTIV